MDWKRQKWREEWQGKEAEVSHDNNGITSQMSAKQLEKCSAEIWAATSKQDIQI